jgi:hypothetical protein
MSRVPYRRLSRRLGTTSACTCRITDRSTHRSSGSRQPVRAPTRSRTAPRTRASSIRRSLATECARSSSAARASDATRSTAPTTTRSGTRSSAARCSKTSSSRRPISCTRTTGMPPFSFLSPRALVSYARPRRCSRSTTSRTRDGRAPMCSRWSVFHERVCRSKTRARPIRWHARSLQPTSFRP